MHKENSIMMKASRSIIFKTAADLSQWPRILPHYRWIRYLKKSPTRNVVVMAANRRWIPVQWTSEQEIDEVKCEVRFHHLKAFTKGMDVVWTFTERPEGIEVRISHDLTPSVPVVGKFIAEYIIGDFFIHYVAAQTLKYMKAYLEALPSLDASPN